MSSTATPATTGPPPAPATRPGRRRRGRAEKPKWGAVALFLGPAVVLLAFFLFYPAIYTLRLSLYRGRLGEFTGFVGLDNYVRLFTRDPAFLDLSTFPPSGALFNNLLWIIFYVSGCLMFPQGDPDRDHGGRPHRRGLRAADLPAHHPADDAHPHLGAGRDPGRQRDQDLRPDLRHDRRRTGDGQPGDRLHLLAGVAGGKYGYGAAVAVIMLAILIPVMVFNVRRFRSEDVRS
jgi:hypothetical protein